MPLVSNPIAPKTQLTRNPVLLIVDDEADICELAGDILRRDLPSARVIAVDSVTAARRLIETETIDLLVTDVNLPDGDGTMLIDHLSRHRPGAGAVVMASAASIDQSVRVFRNGAIDYLPKPFTADTFSERILKAVRYQHGVQRTEKRLSRLRSAVRKLNTARRMVSKKVDLLCNDLVTAYGDLARQFEDVRVRENFRSTISAAQDLEQMLCHAMDWILRQAGYTNIAIYLAGDDGTVELGAYMKYTIQGSKSLTDALKQGVVEQTLRDEFVHYTDRDAAEHLSPAELDHVANYAVMSVNSTYLGESLGVITMFRDGKTPFTAEDAATLRTIAPIFAHVLTQLARQDIADDIDDMNPDGGDNDLWPDDSADATDSPESRDEKPKKKKDDADWWKRGEPPPY
jgi:FixJ family two-component response regulator